MPSTPSKPQATPHPASTAATGAAPDPQKQASEDAAKRKDEMNGTHILPVPDDAPTVAGMPRRGRSLAEPGDPGNISPADDVYGNDPADLSQTR